MKSEETSLSSGTWTDFPSGIRIRCIEMVGKVGGLGILPFPRVCVKERMLKLYHKPSYRISQLFPWETHGQAGIWEHLSWSRSPFYPKPNTLNFNRFSIRIQCDLLTRTYLSPLLFVGYILICEKGRDFLLYF